MYSCADSNLLASIMEQQRVIKQQTLVTLTPPTNRLKVSPNQHWQTSPLSTELRKPLKTVQAQPKTATSAFKRKPSEQTGNSGKICKGFERVTHYKALQPQKCLHLGTNLDTLAAMSSVFIIAIPTCSLQIESC